MGGDRKDLRPSFFGGNANATEETDLPYRIDRLILLELEDPVCLQEPDLLPVKVLQGLLTSALLRVPHRSVAH